MPGVSDRILIPWNAWSDASAWEDAACSLAEKFRQNFVPYASEAGEAVVNAGPAS